MRYNWAKGAKGTVQVPPDSVQELVADQFPWQGCCRFVKGRRGFIRFYWVEFDEPQIDPDGDGPYSATEIEADMLEPINE